MLDLSRFASLRRGGDGQYRGRNWLEAAFDSRGSLRGETFLAAEKAKPLRRRRFDAHTLDRKPEHFSRARTHGVAIRADLGALADQRHIDMHQTRACVGDALQRMAQ